MRTTTYRLARSRRRGSGGHGSALAGLGLVVAVPAVLVAFAVAPHGAHAAPAGHGRATAAQVAERGPAGHVAAHGGKQHRSHVVLRTLVRFGAYRLVRHLFPHRLFWRPFRRWYWRNRR